MHIDSFDLSHNAIGDRGLAKIASTLHTIAPESLRMLKLHHNTIVDATPLVEIIGWGKLAELHLSHNDLNAKSILEVVVAAVSAKDGEGNDRYPRGTSPLWLRMECNRQTAETSEKLSTEITAALSALGRPLWRSLCVVNGQTQCCPGRCHQKPNAPPAVHLTYMDFHAEKGLDAKISQPQRPKPRNIESRWARTAVATPVEQETVSTIDVSDFDAFPPLPMAIGEPARHGKDKHWATPSAACELQSHTGLACPAWIDATPAVPTVERQPTCKLAIRDYEAEAVGYISVRFGDPIFIHSDEYAGSPGCTYATYYWAENRRTHELGWFPNMAGQCCDI